MKVVVALLFLAFSKPSMAAGIPEPGPAQTIEEQNGCAGLEGVAPSPDLTTAREICAVYYKFVGFHGSYSMRSPGVRQDAVSSEEPQYCVAYFTNYARGRNVLCSYQKEAKAKVDRMKELKALELMAAVRRGGTLSDTQIDNFKKVTDLYGEMRAMHKKYAALIKKYVDLEALGFREISTKLPGFGNSMFSNKEVRDRQAIAMRNSEANCKGGNVSLIPSIWFVAINSEMSKVFQAAHPKAEAALKEGLKLAEEGASAFGNLELATANAGGRMNTAGVPQRGTVEVPPANHEPHAPHMHNPAVEAGIAAGLEKGVAHPLSHALELGPAQAKIVGLIVGLGFEGLRGGVKNIDFRTVAVVGTGALGLIPGAAAAGLDAIIKNDESNYAAYMDWARAKIREKPENERLSAKDLSEGYCNWVKEEAERTGQLRRQAEEQNQQRAQESQRLIGANRNQYNQDWERVRQLLRNSPGSEANEALRNFRAKWLLGPAESSAPAAHH